MVRRKFKSRLKALLGTFAVGAILTLISGVSANAQDAFGVSSVLLEKITVTARKREEPIQNVPLSVTHFSSEEIDTLKVRNLESLAVKMPNVALDDIGTVGGIANFSIRGLGINSSIPSVDPTVGVFVDGVYFGANIGGALFDTLDIESIEVLRGPQGTLFGRNVTGGAILINTKKPGDTLEVSFRTSFEGGGESLNSYYMGTVGGPLGETVSARITAYTNQDNGWFKNLHTGKAFGDLDVRMVRPVLVWEPTDDLSLVLRYQYDSIDGDGPAAQNHTNGFGAPNAAANFDRDSHDFSINHEGKRENEAHFFAAQADWDVGFGDGTITNIFGWRDSKTFSSVDLDASPLELMNAQAWSNYRQWSNELRYTGRFLERLNATTGVYYFSNKINYNEHRSLLTDAIAASGLPFPPGTDVSQFGGGNYDVETLGLFLSLDYDLTSHLTLTAGARYTRDKREGEIALIPTSSPLAPLPSCNIVEGPDCEFDFIDEETWHSWSPKLGATYYISGEANVYGHWTRGFRSGGYNLRNLSPDHSPGPYDEEMIDSFEAGFKVTKDRGRLYGAVFYNMIDDMQREINFPDPALGIVQLIDNTADVETYGFELDGLFAIAENLFLTGSVGYVNPEYTKVKADLNRDGDLDVKDLDLELPRAAKWTYSVGLTHDTGAGSWGRMTSRVSYAYRDKSYFTDDNRGYILEQNILDAGIDIIPANGRFSIGLYGKNLLDEVKHGGDSQLPITLGAPPLSAPLGGTFSPLAKGRIFGVQLTYRHKG
jgi:iron complex outermembrane receptor protein